jgi:ferredoxin
MLVINPDSCIDCGICEPECPAEAILSDGDPRATRWINLNRQYSAVWPNITRPEKPPADADIFKAQKDKFTKYFSDKPAT